MNELKIKVIQFMREYIAKAPPHLPYVFIIGFNKTATTTLHFFFEKNGFPSIHWDNNRLAKTMINNCLNDRPVLKGYDRRFRVFSDMIAQSLRLRFEANSLFRALDRDYPGSYFLFNNRNTEEWLASRWRKPCGRYKCTYVELEMQILNTTNVQDVIDTWNNEKTDFERDVRHYFAGSDRFLEFDIKDPAAPQKIADLIGMQLDPIHWGHIKTNRPSAYMRSRIEALGPPPHARKRQVP